MLLFVVVVVVVGGGVAIVVAAVCCNHCAHWCPLSLLYIYIFLKVAEAEFWERFGSCKFS